MTFHCRHFSEIEIWKEMPHGKRDRQTECHASFIVQLWKTEERREEKKKLKVNLFFLSLFHFMWELWSSLWFMLLHAGWVTKVKRWQRNRNHLGRRAFSETIRKKLKNTYVFVCNNKHNSFFFLKTYDFHGDFVHSFINFIGCQQNITPERHFHAHILIYMPIGGATRWNGTMIDCIWPTHSKWAINIYIYGGMESSFNWRWRSQCDFIWGIKMMNDMRSSHSWYYDVACGFSSKCATDRQNRRMQFFSVFHNSRIEN